MVYNGNGNSVTVSSLSASTTYYYAVFEYDGTSCYLTPGASSSQATTACGGGCPTTQATSLSYSSVTCTGMTVSWTNGNGADRLVVAYPNATITSPTNGNTYTANTTYGNGTSVGAGFVVYNGSGSSVSVTGLSASTTYHFAVFEYNSSSCYLTPGLSSSKATTACGTGCPTTQATSLTYSAVACNGMTISWTNGNGADRLVVAYPTSTITSPTNGTTYLANAAYGSGTAVGAGFVIYNGTGSSVTVSSLSASTTYYFAVFEYNTISCYLTPALSSSQATISCSGCPTVDASNITFSHVGCNAMVLNWVNGNGADRLVIAYPNSTITNPTNSTTYTANATYGSGTAVGSGYVVYRGTGSTVTVLGLSATTTYYFGIFEYNTTACYYTPGISAHDATTACTYCPYMSTAMTDGCNSASGCNEGDSEFLILNSCSYGWNNGSVAPTVDYGSSTTSFPTYTVTGTSDYTAESSTTASLNSATGCTSNFIDASNGAVTIPPWSTILYCAAGGGGPWCPDNYDLSGICSVTSPIYVLYAVGGYQTSGNFANSGSGARYFYLDFSPVTGGSSCQEYYSYDRASEASGDGAYEIYKTPISSNSSSATAPKTYGQSCSLAPIMLPIKLLSFTAAYNSFNHTVGINWATATETNNKLFTIEKTSDGINWQTVATEPGAGNSTHAIYYTATDETPYSGISYYRLKQTDFDGRYTYSDLRAVNVNLQSKSVTLAPNPSNTSVTVTFNSPVAGNATLNIYDLAGRLLDSKLVTMTKGATSVILNVSGYGNGMYFLTVDNSLQRYSTKLVITHTSSIK